MKINYKKFLLIILAAIILLVGAFAAYFHVQLSGNPIDGWKEKRSVLSIYEDRYGEDFKVVDTSYSYKRHEFTFTMHPADDPELKFRTTLDEAGRKDAYGNLRAVVHITELVRDALGSDYDYLEYSLNIYEEYDSPGVLETDLSKRLAMSEYTIDFRWDVEVIESAEIEAIFNEMVNKIEYAIIDPFGSLTIRLSVYDGEDYYFSDIEFSR